MYRERREKWAVSGLFHPALKQKPGGYPCDFFDPLSTVQPESTSEGI